MHAVLRRGASTTPFAWRFTVAEVDSVSRSLETPPPPPPPAKPSEVQHFLGARTCSRRPSRSAPTRRAQRTRPATSSWRPTPDLGEYGPMILDGAGDLLWFEPIPTGERAADLRVQEYEGRPVLTWWQDPLISGGRRDAGVVIASSSYQDVAIVRAGNGYQPDLHAFEITPAGTALFTVYDAIALATSAPTGARPTAPSPTRCSRRSTCARGSSGTSGTRSTM